ncbi:hypothetical protein OKA04_09740 [Luteolibacter flavescens]|uniref:SGNH hydrolase-type esterase domain-containing protein n=1 Tax=Luteolibacter flavescens TaxID=1859460 RepID=A0ABT3FN58_9BACT|nr:hypothetical protein [Luteolibacter flavescens]MCW1885008.1 hypothetical protein [Luteolibacter flavescens]
MSAFRGYSVGLVAVIAVASLASFALNTFVNPWRVTPMPWSSESLEPYRDISSQLRTGKAGIVRANEGIGVGLIGSSRVANGLDPEYAGWHREDVVNLGCLGGFIYESSAMAHYLMQEREVEVILFGVDPGDLSSKKDTRPMGDFHASPLASNEEFFNREIRYLIGVSTFEASVETLKRASLDEVSQYTSKGLRANPKRRGQRVQIDFIRARIKSEAAFDVMTGANPAVNPDKAKVLEDLMREARRRGVRLVAFYHPSHALMYARAADVDAPDVVYENERRAMLDLARKVNAEDLEGPPVEVWDFAGFHPLNCDPLPQDAESVMPSWGDLEHYSLEVGNIIQSRIMGWPVPVQGAENYGRRLTSASIEPWFRDVREGYRAYLTGAGAADVAKKEEWIAEGVAKAK